jgi:dihydrofolate reductase
MDAFQTNLEIEMRKIVMANWVSIDGFFAGPNGEIDWIVRDPEVDQAWHEIGDMQADTLLSGRLSYQGFESFWPQVARDPNAPEGMRALADEMNGLTKVVFSKTMKEVTWENSKLLHGDLIEEVKKLKQGSGASIVIFGSGTIVQQLSNEGLIDDYVLTVTPVVLGTGKSLFKDVNKLNLKLLGTRSFNSGNVLLHYATAG